MTKKNKIPDRHQIWIDVRRRYHLSDAHIQMARELGMNPKKFGKISNEKQEPWKKPFPLFIEDIYLKRFGRDRPSDVKSIEAAFSAGHPGFFNLGHCDHAKMNPQEWRPTPVVFSRDLEGAELTHSNLES